MYSLDLSYTNAANSVLDMVVLPLVCWPVGSTQPNVPIENH